MDKTIRRYFYSKEHAEQYNCHVINYNGDEIPFTEVTTNKWATNKYDDNIEVFRCYEDEDRKLDICHNQYKGKYIIIQSNSSSHSGKFPIKEERCRNPHPDKMPEANIRWLDKEKYQC